MKEKHISTDFRLKSLELMKSVVEFYPNEHSIGMGIEYPSGTVNG